MYNERVQIMRSNLNRVAIFYTASSRIEHANQKLKPVETDTKLTSQTFQSYKTF